MVTRIAQELGMDAGPASELYEATDWNPSGYIQRPDITQFNTRLITAAGGTLTEPGTPLSIFEKTDAAIFSQLDLSWMAKCENVVIKDPRLCYTLYSWYLHNMLSGFMPMVIRVSRDTETAAQSALAHYDVKHYCNNSLDTALSVIQSYNDAAVWHITHLPVPHIHICYEALIRTPELVVGEIAAALEVTDPHRIRSAITATNSGKSIIEKNQLMLFQG
ncbi:MAG TPA: hypothetical protein VIC08_05730 [Cellvibrionaceae bacterium]